MFIAVVIFEDFCKMPFKALYHVAVFICDVIYTQLVAVIVNATAFSFRQ